MKVYRGLDEFNRLTFGVVTTGIFDGVHKGHQKVLSRVSETAKNSGGESVVITFYPHPKKVLQPHLPPPPVLTTIDEKTGLISDCGIDHLLIIPFTREISEMSSYDFVTKVLVEKAGTKKLIIGYDHKFGKNREGSFDFLKENSRTFGFEVEEIPRQDIDDMGVSSTSIRKALKEGEVSTAASYLGRFYSITASVVPGKKLGHTIGFPTANLKVNDPEKLIPMDGIYAVKVRKDDKLYCGMMSIGYNPTVHGTEKTMEVNIFNFNEDIYGKEIEIFFVAYLRKEEKYNSLEELIGQLHKDKEDSLRILSNTQIPI